MPGTPVPFGFSKGNINNNNSENQLSGQQNNLDVKKALVAFKNILSRSEWSNDEPEEEAGRMYDDDEEEDLYNFDDEDDENSNDIGYHTFKSTYTPVVHVM